MIFLFLKACNREIVLINKNLAKKHLIILLHTFFWNVFSSLFFFFFPPPLEGGNLTRCNIWEFGFGPGFGEGAIVLQSVKGEGDGEWVF